MCVRMSAHIYPEYTFLMEDLYTLFVKCQAVKNTYFQVKETRQ